MKSNHREKEDEHIKTTNRIIWQSPLYLQMLGGYRFHVRDSLAIAKLTNRLLELRKPIEEVRLKKLEEYALKDEKGKPVKNETGNVQMEDDAAWNKAFNELMDAECSEEVIKETVKLPEKIAASCDKCHYHMEKPFEIEPSILTALEPFVEVSNA